MRTRMAWSVLWSEVPARTMGGRAVPISRSVGRRGLRQWVVPRRELDPRRSHKRGPEELQAMRAMSPEARRILLRQMNEAERQARSSSEH
jgi:hypothetical protein